MRSAFLPVAGWSLLVHSLIFYGAWRLLRSPLFVSPKLVLCITLLALVATSFTWGWWRRPTAIAAYYAGEALAVLAALSWLTIADWSATSRASSFAAYLRSFAGAPVLLEYALWLSAPLAASLVSVVLASHLSSRVRASRRQLPDPPPLRVKSS